MNWLDIVIIAVVGIPAFLGFRIGVIKTAFTLGGLIAGLILARLYNSDLAAVLATFVENETGQTVGAFVLIVIGAVVAASIAARFVKGVLSAILLGWVDNVFGALLGVVVGSSVLTGILLVMEVTGSSAVEESTLAPAFQALLGPVLEIALGNAEALVPF